MGEKKAEAKLKPDQFYYDDQLWGLPAVVPDMPNSVYHGPEFNDFIGHSALVQAVKSPAHLKVYLNQLSNPQTSAMEFGTAAHLLVMEGDESKIAYTDEWKSMKGKAAWEWKERELADGKEAAILQADYLKLQLMKDVVMRHGPAWALIKDAIKEQSVFLFDDKFDGVKCKIRIDLRRDDVKVIADYKTAASCEIKDFMYAAVKWGYDIQAAYYKKIIKLLTGEDYEFVFIVQEKEPPFPVMVYRATEDFIKLGEARMNAGLETYWKCLLNPQLFKDAFEPKIYPLHAPVSSLRDWGVVFEETQKVEIEDVKPDDVPGLQHGEKVA